MDQQQKMNLILNYQEKIEKIENEIANMISKQNALKIKEHYANMTECGFFNVTKMWKLKKQILPAKNSHPSAKKDAFGNLVTNKKSIISLYKDEYVKRLSLKPPLPQYKDGQILKERLFEKRMELSSLIISDNWTINDINKVCS